MHNHASNELIHGGGPLVSIILTVAMVGYIVYRQMTPRKVNLRSLILFPLIVLFFLLRALPSFHPSAGELIDIGIDIVVTIVLGLLAARQLTVTANESTGMAEAHGSWQYFLWWIAAFAVKAGLAMLFKERARGGLSQVGILVPPFFLMVTRSAYLYWKAGRLGLKVR